MRPLEGRQLGTFKSGIFQLISKLWQLSRTPYLRENARMGHVGTFEVANRESRDHFYGPTLETVLYASPTKHASFQRHRADCVSHCPNVHDMNCGQKSSWVTMAKSLQLHILAFLQAAKVNSLNKDFHSVPLIRSYHYWQGIF